MIKTVDQLLEEMLSPPDENLILHGDDYIDAYRSAKWKRVVQSNRQWVKKRRLKRGYWTTYLAGAMESPEDHGIGWRLDCTPKLHEYGIKIVHDPCKEEDHKTGRNPGDTKRMLYGFKRGGKWDQFDETMTKIQDVDISLVRDADFNTVMFVEVTGGTNSEMWDQLISGGFNLMICYGAKSNINSWALQTVMSYGYVFPNMHQYLEFIKTLIRAEEKIRQEGMR